MNSEKLIMIVDREILFNDCYFKGFKSQNEIDYESKILANFNYMKRGLAEEDTTNKQPIGYSMIVNPISKQVFAYQRSKHDSKYAEKRLQGKWSWGIGGHIEKFDTKNKNPIRTSVLREVGEEVEVDGTVNPIVLGYINDDSDDVGKVHFGILYVIETNSRIVKPKDPEIDNGKLRSIEELEEISSSPDYSIENWSRISLEPLKKYIKNEKLTSCRES